MEETLITTSPEQTKQLAGKILKTNQNLITLKGDLGAGKTTLVQGLGELLGIDRMTSPTFTLIRQYPLKKSSYKTLYHIDLYRLNSADEASELGLEELWLDKQNLVLIEWPEIISALLPPHLEIKLNVEGEHERKITLINHS